MFKRLFQKKPQMVDVAEACGTRLSVGELKAALKDAQTNPQVRAVLQLLAMTRQSCLVAAQDAAWKAGNPAFHLGGIEALDDLMTEILARCQGKPEGDDVKQFFR